MMLDRCDTIFQDKRVAIFFAKEYYAIIPGSLCLVEQLLRLGAKLDIFTLDTIKFPTLAEELAKNNTIAIF